jgi:hypothetical protein
MEYLEGQTRFLPAAVPACVVRGLRSVVDLILDESWVEFAVSLASEPAQPAVHRRTFQHLPAPSAAATVGAPLASQSIVVLIR